MSWHPNMDEIERLKYDLKEAKAEVEARKTERAEHEVRHQEVYRVFRDTEIERDCYQNMLMDIRTYILKAYDVVDEIPMSTVRGWLLITCEKYKVDPDKLEAEND